MTKLNEMFQMDRQDGKYFTIWYGVYRPAERALAYCNAWRPPRSSTRAARFNNWRPTVRRSGWFRNCPTTPTLPPLVPGRGFSFTAMGCSRSRSPMGRCGSTDFVKQIVPELAHDGDLMERCI